MHLQEREKSKVIKLFLQMGSESDQKRGLKRDPAPRLHCKEREDTRRIIDAKVVLAHRREVLGKKKKKNGKELRFL